MCEVNRRTRADMHFSCEHPQPVILLTVVLTLVVQCVAGALWAVAKRCVGWGGEGARSPVPAVPMVSANRRGQAYEQL